MKETNRFKPDAPMIGSDGNYSEPVIIPMQNGFLG